MLTAKVKRFNPITKYGFLVPDGGGDDVYVHSEICVSSNGGTVCLDAGQEVEYVAMCSRGKWKATRVTLPGGKPFQGVGMPLDGAPGLGGVVRPMYTAVQPSSMYQQMGMPQHKMAPWSNPASGDTGDQLQRGVIKRFNPKSQYGFLTDGKGGPDVFVHSEVVEPFGFELTTDLEVQYTATNRGGRLKATRCIVPGALPPALPPATAAALAALRPTGPNVMSPWLAGLGSSNPMGASMGQMGQMGQMSFGDYSLGVDGYAPGISDLPQLDAYSMNSRGGGSLGAMGGLSAQMHMQQMQQAMMQQQLQQFQMPAGPGPLGSGPRPPARYAPY